MRNPLIAMLSFLSTQALAHNGDHTHFDYAGIIAHLSEPDHLVIIGLAIATSVYAVKRYRAHAVSKVKNHEPR